MANIKDIFNEKDIIIESMSYFNPLILEEHNVVVTEGVVGGIVEKLKALYEMIKGWLSKLISFVADKFSGKGRKKSSSDSSTTNSEKKAESGSSKTKTTSDADNVVKLPKLKDAKKAVASLIKDCQNALRANKPDEYFDADPKSYFLDGNQEQKITLKELAKNPIYGSYSEEVGKDCLDKLRSYQKSLEDSYKEMQRNIERFKDANKEQTDKIIVRAKSTNKMTQRVLGTGVKTLAVLVNKISLAVGRAKRVTRND